MSSTTTLARVATAAVLVLGLAACQAIEVHPDGSVTSHATRAVSPTTTRVGSKTVAAVERVLCELAPTRLGDNDGPGRHFGWIEFHAHASTQQRAQLGKPEASRAPY